MISDTENLEVLTATIWKPGTAEQIGTAYYIGFVARDGNRFVEGDFSSYKKAKSRLESLKSKGLKIEYKE